MKQFDRFSPGILIVQLAVIIAMLTGCRSGVTGKSLGQPSISREEAGSIAAEEMRRQGWREVEIEAVQLREGHWFVLVQTLPLVPGGHALVEISSDGEIIRFHGGK